jgi:predicted neutral ceramidase superfamily lipid hydrolase
MPIHLGDFPVSVLRFARRIRLFALAVAVTAAVLLLAMSAAPVPGPFTGLCAMALVYGAAIAMAVFVHERQQLRALHADVADFLRAHAV